MGEGEEEVDGHGRAGGGSLGRLGSCSSPSNPQPSLLNRLTYSPNLRLPCARLAASRFNFLASLSVSA